LEILNFTYPKNVKIKLIKFSIQRYSWEYVPFQCIMLI
jgi:hypothetical protein